MTRTEVIREFMGAAIDAARQSVSAAQHAVRLGEESKEQLNDVKRKLDYIIRLLGERDAKSEALRADHNTLAEQVQRHERKILAL